MREEKAQKEEVHYTPHAEVHSERCELCKHFIPLYNKCRLVEGKIAAAGWCRLFKRGRSAGSSEIRLMSPCAHAQPAPMHKPQQNHSTALTI